MPGQRLVLSSTDPQCTDDSLHHAGTNDSDSDSDSPSRHKIGLTKSYDSSGESSDSHLPTNTTGSSEAESSAGGVGKKEQSKEPSRRVEDSLTQYQVQIGPNYSYQVQIDGKGRLRRLSEIDQDGRERRLSLRSLGDKDGPFPDSPFSDTDEDEPTTLKEYRDRGTSALGQRNSGRYASPPSLQEYTARNEKTSQDEYKAGKKQDEEKKDYIGREKQSHYVDNEDRYSGFWTELRADME